MGSARAHLLRAQPIREVNFVTIQRTPNTDGARSDCLILSHTSRAGETFVRRTVSSRNDGSRRAVTIVAMAVGRAISYGTLVGWSVSAVAIPIRRGYRCTYTWTGPGSGRSSRFTSGAEEAPSPSSSPRHQRRLAFQEQRFSALKRVPSRLCPMALLRLGSPRPRSVRPRFVGSSACRSRRGRRPNSCQAERRCPCLGAAGRDHRADDEASGQDQGLGSKPCHGRHLLGSSSRPFRRTCQELAPAG